MSMNLPDKQPWFHYVDKHLETRRKSNFSSTTLGNELKQFQFLFKFIERHIKDPNTITNELDFTPQIIIQYLEHLKQKGNKDNTIRTRLGGLKPFYKTAVREGLMLNSPLSDDVVRLPKQEVPVLKVLSIQQVKQLIKSIPLNTALGWRNLLIVHLLYGSALRRFELLSLTPKNFSNDQTTIRIIGKGKKEEVIPMTKVSQHVLSFYISAIWPILNKQQLPFIFLDTNNGNQLSESGLEKVLRDQGKAIGLKWNLSPHCFRYSIATSLADTGGDVRYIQCFLRHDSIDTTGRYLKINYQKLASVHKETHPRAKAP